MSNKFKIILISAATLLGSSLFATQAFAFGSILYQSTPTNWDSIGGSGFREFGTSFVPSTTLYTCSVGLALGNNNSDSNSWTIYLRDGGTNPSDGALLSATATVTTDWPTGGSPAITDFNLNFCTNLIAGHTYFIHATKTAGDYTTWAMGKILSGVNPEQNSVWTYNGTTWSQFSGDQELSIRFRGPYTQIGFNTLTNGGTYADFSNWSVGLGYPANNSVIKVSYYTTGNASTTYNDQSVWFPPLSSSAFIIPKSQPLWHAPYVSSINWVASVAIYDPTGTTIVASSSPIGFIINATAPISYTPTSTTPYATATSTASFQFGNVDCTVSTGWFDVPTGEGWYCILRKSGAWLFQSLFVPSNLSTDYMRNTYADFEQVFPFSIFFKITNTLSAGIADTSLGSAKSVVYTFESPRLYSVTGAVIYATSTDSITFSQSTTLASLIGADIVLLLFNGILMVAILVMIYLIYRMFFHH